MPLFFFHIRDSAVIHDEVGTELPDDLAARQEAVRLLAGIVADHADEFWAEGRWSVQVLESDKIVATLDFLGQLPLADADLPSVARPTVRASLPE